MIKKITSRSNPHLKFLISEKSNYFFFEGEKLVKDILNGKIPVSKLIMNFNQQSRLEIPPNRIEELWLVNDSILKKLSSLKEKSDFIAVVKIRSNKISLKNEKFTIALDNIQDPLNAGSIFRCAAAFGINSVFFTGNCVKPNNSKFLRAAQTSILEVKFQYYPDITDLIKKCQLQNINIYLTSSKVSQKNIKIKDIKSPAIIFFGNEGKGLAEELFNQIPSIRIPQKNCIESLNVGISACIVMYELKSQFNL